MSDAEIVCAFMEIKPASCDERRGFSSDGWWRWWWSCADNDYVARANDDKYDSLDALREVQARLTEEQRRHYSLLMFHACCTEARTINPIEDLLTKNRWPLLHADAPTRAKALAAILRPIVEGSAK